MKRPSLVELRSVRDKRRILTIAGMILIICVGIGLYLLARSRDPLESSFAAVRGDASSKTAIIQLRNVSERQITFRASRLYYRFHGKEWNIDPPPTTLAGLSYPRYVKPGMAVDFPIPLRTQEGGPITGALEVGILYSTTKKTWVASLPVGIRNSIGTAVGITEGKAVRGVHWIGFVAP